MTTDKQPKPHFEHPQTQSKQPAFGQVDNSAPDFVGLTQQVDDLSSDLDQKIANHKHDGGTAQRINFNTDIIGLFETVSTVPTIVPTSPFDQVKIYVNGATLRLYWYDSNANVWHYVTATA